MTLESSRLAQLVERKTLNLVVVGSSPTVGATFLGGNVLPVETQSYGYRPDLAPVAQLAARRSHNPKVASSILAGSILFSFLFSHSRDAAGRTWATLEVPRLSVGWPSGPRR